MVPIRIMNWNVQNLGPTKAGITYNNFDVLKLIAKVVVDNHIDILVLLEINTTQTGTASQVMNNLRAELVSYATHKGHPHYYDTCVLSPNTGVEFYGFFIKDTTVVRPVVGNASRFDDATLLTNGQFTSVLHQTGLLADVFPLLQPDVKQTARVPRAASTVSHSWPATRLPSLGLFEIIGTGMPENRYLPIIACHFAPAHDTAKKQIDTLQYFSLLKGLDGKSTPLNLTIDGVRVPMEMAVVTGDFNIDWRNPNPPKGYQGLTKDLWFSGCYPDTTHLITPGVFDSRLHKLSTDLIVNAFDNFFVKGEGNGGRFTLPHDNAGHRHVAANERVDVPNLLRKRQVFLRSSVKHYAQLDQRGIVGSEAYLPFLKDFKSQLAGVKSNDITLQAALIGGRLVSDHLPVFIELQLA